MQTSAHPPSAALAHPNPARRQPRALTKARAPSPAPFPRSLDPKDPSFWAVALQQDQLAIDALERAIDALHAGSTYDKALAHGLWAGIRQLRSGCAMAAQQLLLNGRILMAVPARRQA